MKKVKEFIKDNIILIIVFILVIIFGAIALIVTKYSHKNIYNPEINETNEINYVKKNYKVNEYQVIDMSIEDLLNAYLKKFLTLQSTNPESAFAMLSTTSKNRFDNNVENYKKYIKENTTIYTKDNIVKKYYVDKNSNKYEIIDSENFKYEIEENATWSIKFTLLGR